MKSELHTKILLRIPRDLKDKLVERALTNNRSVTAEIVFMIKTLLAKNEA